MIITNKINAYIHQNSEYRMDAVQGDTARVLELALFAGAEKWPVPEGTVVQVRFRKSDGTGGHYDTLPDGTCAYEVRDHLVKVALAPQVLTVAGEVEAQVLLAWKKKELATFTFRIAVQPDPSLGVLNSEDYVNLTSWVHEQVHQYLREAQEELRELYAKPDTLVVHVQKTDSGYASSKSYAQILAAGPALPEGESGRYVYCVLWRDMDREYMVLPLTAYDAIAQRLTFTCMDGEGRFRVTVTPTEVRVDWVRMAKHDEIPSVLPNPESLSINGRIYDGVDEIEVDTRAMYVGVRETVAGWVADWSLDMPNAAENLSQLDMAYEEGRPLICRYMGNLGLQHAYGSVYDPYNPHGYIFSGVVDGIHHRVRIGSDGVSVTSTELAKKEDIPETLPNPKELCINGWIYDGTETIEVDTRPVVVTVDAVSSGFVADKTLTELERAHEDGRALYCNYGTRLPLVGEYGSKASLTWGYTFKGVNSGNEYMVNIGTDGVRATSTKLVPDKLPNPQPLTINGRTYDGSYSMNISTNADFRLIEKRELTEEVKTLTFDGFSLSSFRAYLAVPQATAASSAGAAAYIGSTLAGYAWLASMVSTSSPRVAMVEGKQQGGLVTYRNTTPANDSANTQIYSQSPVCVEATGPFTKLEISSSASGLFPVGTVVQLWGTDSDTN